MTTIIETLKPFQELVNVNQAVQQLGKNKELVSDGFHTFKELYDIRLAYNAVLFNEWAKQPDENQFISINEHCFQKFRPKYSVHKSWRHYDGKLCFGGDWFIVVAQLPSGQISNHYEAEYWDLFKIPETEKALFPYDGHSTNDVIERLINL
jgi:hypothetical protein